ncbi:esterase-like activity of phytase family protein [Nocardia sp. NPDC005978]|uniref:esterase-like activity of phytase family protein n=1 Tax=Nocardia sp. NPDC005978 TaxID=3156725 RepID=UPI0033AD68AE
MTFSRPSTVLLAAAAGLGLAITPIAEPAPAHADLGGLGLRYVNSVTLPDELSFDGFKVGGLSGIDYNAAARSYLAISDNRGEQGPVRAYTLDLPIGADGKLGDPRFDTLIRLRDIDGQPYAPRAADTESIRWLPTQQGFYYTSEGEAKTGRPGFLRQAAMDGSYVRDLPVPAAFTPELDDAGVPVAGIRDNLGFEAMAPSFDNTALIAVSENALVQDGPAAGTDAESRARLVQIQIGTGADLAEYIYPTDRVAPGAIPSAAGVAEILPIDAGRFLTLERGYDPRTGFTARIYETSFAGADPVTGMAVAPATARPMGKKLLFDFTANGIDPQCAEGMTWGPALRGGARSLILVSDNNFGLAGKTAFHLLAVDGGGTGSGSGDGISSGS